MDNIITQKETYYTWRERKGERLIIPCSDPTVYEMPYDFIFQTVDEAIAAIEELSMPYDPETWVLVYCTEEVVDLTPEHPALLQMAITRRLYDAYTDGGSDAVRTYVEENHPEWPSNICPCCEDEVPVFPDEGVDYCAVCWQVLS